jgi:hypothetical protein
MAACRGGISTYCAINVFQRCPGNRFANVVAFGIGVLRRGESRGHGDTQLIVQRELSNCFRLRRNIPMRYAWVLILCVVGSFKLPVAAQDKSHPSAGNATLEKELYAVELKWMKAEHDKKMTGPDSMGEMWMDDFFDVLPGGRVVNKQEMMDMMGQADPKPGTGAFPVDFKIRAIYGNVVLATDHTTIKGLDASGKIVSVREMNVLRMFVKDKGKWRVAGAGLVPVVSH